MTQQTQTGFVGLEENAPQFHIIATINRLLLGRLNAFQDFTLAANAATTTITDPRIGANTAIVLVPQTTNAAAALSTTFIPKATMKKGSAVINHANTVQTDRSFRALLIG